ncbi:uncharacterized protein LOC121370547 isoform X2 [Gigantopelta aegis]|uniref:uncharacterized protein LOC121370547 isoform X2 n=1 Tax=Gigantopelta aegis TaxID=1735272 RepID=UPI001B88AE94|nr:uncharacterized protein LOC121370547 isoform X2 [Gigantopelta aegis]
MDRQKQTDAAGGNKWRRAVAKNSYRKIFSKPKVAKHPVPSPKTVVKAPKILKKPTRPLSKQKSELFNALLQPLPVSPADESEKTPIETEPEPPLVPEPTTQVSEDITVKRVSRSPIKKRERVVTYQKPVRDATPSTEPTVPETGSKKASDWIFNSDDETGETDTGRDKSCSVSACQPHLPSVADLPTASTPAEKLVRAKRRLTALNLKPADNKKQWGPRKRDTSYLDELRKQELAEERRLRQQQMYERLHSKKRIKDTDEEDDDLGPNFDDYSFLAKYCIFNRSNLEMYRHAFNAVDDADSGHLSGPDAMLALRVINNKLTTSEEQYIYRILELVGYKITDGADFKLFSVLAALSQRISSLDNWMKNFIGQVDFGILEMKTFMCKTLWECNVDEETNKIPLPQLLIDLRAGGVSFQHECEIRDKLSHLSALDLLDFLTYVPLFIMIHESVVDNPLDDSRDK